MEFMDKLTLRKRRDRLLNPTTALPALLEAAMFNQPIPDQTTFFEPPPSPKPLQEFLKRDFATQSDPPSRVDVDVQTSLPSIYRRVTRSTDTQTDAAASASADTQTDAAASASADTQTDAAASASTDTQTDAAASTSVDTDATQPNVYENTIDKLQRDQSILLERLKRSVNRDEFNSLKEQHQRVMDALDQAMQYAEVRKQMKERELNERMGRKRTAFLHQIPIPKKRTPSYPWPNKQSSADFNFRS